MKIIDVVSIITVGWLSIIIGWFVSAAVTSFMIGYESFKYGEFKRSLLYKQNKIIDDLLEEIKVLKKEKKDV